MDTHIYRHTHRHTRSIWKGRGGSERMGGAKQVGTGWAVQLLLMDMYRAQQDVQHHRNIGHDTAD